MTSLYDPGRLALALMDLEEELRHWCAAASSGLLDALFEYQQGQEKVYQAQWRANLARDQAERDRDDVRQEQEFVAQLLNRTRDAVRTAEWTSKEVDQAQYEAGDAFRYCRDELHKALEWLKRAEERLDRAVKWLAQAEANLSAAMRHLSSAESALRN